MQVLTTYCFEMIFNEMSTMPYRDVAEQGFYKK